MIRCSSCRELGAATSWIAIGPKWTRLVRVFRDGEETGSPLLEGVGSEIWSDISRLASDSVLVLR
jgi:hypothetical protein